MTSSSFCSEVNVECLGQEGELRTQPLYPNMGNALFIFTSPHKTSSRPHNATSSRPHLPTYHVGSSVFLCVDRQSGNEYSRGIARFTMQFWLNPRYVVVRGECAFEGSHCIHLKSALTICTLHRAIYNHRGTVLGSLGTGPYKTRSSDVARR